MPKLVKNKKINYTVIDNNIFKNKNLSLKAKGLLCLMLSLPDNWDYTLAGLATLSKDGVDATRSALNELEAERYFTRRVIREKGKFDDVDYVVSETPMLENPISVNPILGNQAQLNTKDNKATKEYNTDIYKAVISDYNSICDRLPRVERLTKSRRRHICARLEERSEEDIKVAFSKINESDFACGNNDRGWHADFDWLMKNSDNISKVLEGKYDNRKKYTKSERELIEAYNKIGGSDDYRPFGD